MPILRYFPKCKANILKSTERYTVRNSREAASSRNFFTGSRQQQGNSTAHRYFCGHLSIWHAFSPAKVKYVAVGNLQPAAVKCHVQKFTTLNSRVDARRPGLSSCTTKRRTLRSHTLECRDECVLDCAIDSQAETGGQTDRHSHRHSQSCHSVLSQR